MELRYLGKFKELLRYIENTSTPTKSSNLSSILLIISHQQRVGNVLTAAQHQHHCGDEMALAIIYAMHADFTTKWMDKIGR